MQDMENQFLVNSDRMLCTNNAYLHYKDEFYNNSIFMRQMQNGGAAGVCASQSKIINAENALKIKPSSRLADNVSCTPRESAPFKCTDDLLLVPSRKNTYQNYIICDNNKICSKSHQILNNMTRRR
jgi:hypothetical protein